MQERILFGTYTKKTSQGIYQGTLDTTAKTLTNDGLLAATQNPTYLALSAKDCLYSVDKKMTRAVSLLGKSTGKLLTN